VPAWGALVACLTGLVTLTSTGIYDLHYSTYTRVPGSVSIHILRTVVLDYGELLAYWFILQRFITIIAAPPEHLRALDRLIAGEKHIRLLGALSPINPTHMHLKFGLHMRR
jgi:hypothetical protein